MTTEIGDTEEVEAKQARWQKAMVRGCIYMFLVPALAGVMLYRGADPIRVLIVSAIVLLLFIVTALWTYSRL